MSLFVCDCGLPASGSPLRPFMSPQAHAATVGAAAKRLGGNRKDDILDCSLHHHSSYLPSGHSLQQLGQLPLRMPLLLSAVISVAAALPGECSIHAPQEEDDRRAMPEKAATRKMVMAMLDGGTPLHFAAAAGALESVSSLQDLCITLSSIDKDCSVLTSHVS